LEFVCINAGVINVKTQLLGAVESKSLKENIPHFEIGDTVEVHCRITEGDKVRIQIFTGTIIARKGKGINEMFTVRRANRAKLYYLRKRSGKSVRLSQRHSTHTKAR
jgi:large subunit ribosomal protein L19